MEKKSIFRCPVCACDLYHEGKSLCCEKKHSYDIAREGYVNLLLANQKGSREPGDSPEMLHARRRFLNAGYYRRLAEAVANRIIKHIEQTGRDVTILDAGCGEGYYSDYLSYIPPIDSRASICGIDISREGVKLAAKRKNDIQWGVASIHAIPVQNESADIILNIFAPHDADEFHRVTAADGILVSVTPGPEHLLGLKEELYETVQLHEDKSPELRGFMAEETDYLRYEFTVIWPQIKSDLLQMTPYYWRTRPGRINALSKSPAPLTTIADFRITVYRKCL